MAVMRYAFLLSKQDIELAKDEVLALVKGKSILDSNVLVIDGKVDARIADRLAYTRKISSLLFHCSYENLLGALETYPWEEIYEESFNLRIRNLTKNKLPFTEKQLSVYVWRRLENPVVKMRNAVTKIELFFTKSHVYCTSLIANVKGSFEARKAHKRPKLHPTAMHPKLARAIINLTGIKRGEILDPFCGSGGILIEAALIGLKPIGYDLDERMIDRAKINLDHYRIKAVLKKKDAKRLKDVNYVVTDLPYGKNSKAEELEVLYLKFLKNLKKHLKKRAVIVFPDFVDYNTIIENAGFKILNEYQYYLHKSLSKRIVLI